MCAADKSDGVVEDGETRRMPVVSMNSLLYSWAGVVVASEEGAAVED